MLHHKGWGLLGLILAVGCTDGAGTTPPTDAGVDAFIGPAAALFEVPRPDQPPASGFYALPYPNDIRVDDGDGHIDMSDHARPNEIIGQYVDMVGSAQRGFSTNASSFVRFDAPIDPASLPGPADSVADAASVYLVNVDPDSPRLGERTPLLFRFEHYAGEAIGDDWLSVLPYPGFPLEEATTYSVVVTNRVRATDGSAVAVAPEFAAIAGTSVPGDAALARAQTLYQPLWDYLDTAGGDERTDVVSASVFTTSELTSLMGKVREVVWSLPAPTMRSVKWLKRQDGYEWYDGVYDAPNFQSGQVPYMQSGGEIVLDSEGLPIVQRMEEMRVSFTVPSGPMPEAGWPVVLYAHGTGGSYHSYRGRSKLLAERGLAVISIDQVLHGPRNPGASPEISFFNFQNPLAARDNTLQGALDNFQLLRLALGFDFTERHPGGRTIRFDPERIYYFGHSQGGLTGPPFLAHEPLVKGAVLSGAGGLLYLSMVLKTEPFDVAGIVSAFVRDYPLDEFNPILALLQGWIDRADSVSYARHLVRDPLPGVGAKHIFQSEGFTDRFTPPRSIEGLATAIGVDQIGPVLARLEGLALRNTAVLTAPVSGNQNGITSVLLQYDEVSGSDGHFVLFDVPAGQQQSADFLGTLASDGVPTIVAPTN